MDNSGKLADFRARLDAIDRELFALFEQRMAVVAEISAYKQAHALPTLDAARERDKLASLSGQVRPDLLPYARTLYQTLFSLSRAYQDDWRQSRRVRS